MTDTKMTQFECGRRHPPPRMHTAASNENPPHKRARHAARSRCRGPNGAHRHNCEHARKRRHHGDGSGWAAAVTVATAPVMTAVAAVSSDGASPARRERTHA